MTPHEPDRQGCPGGCIVNIAGCYLLESAGTQADEMHLSLEVADEIVVINEGRVQQVGSPDEFSHAPANDFMMGLLGDVTRLNGLALRPHDVEVSLSPDLAGAMPGDILRRRLQHPRDARAGRTVRVTAPT